MNLKEVRGKFAIKSVLKYAHNGTMKQMEVLIYVRKSVE
jgi:hypothetical protein